MIDLINSLKTDHGRLLTNSYRRFTDENDTVWNVVAGDKAILMIVREELVTRIEFYAERLTDIAGLVSELPSGEYCLEYIYRGRNEYADKLMEVGFSPLKTMQRCCNYDIGTTLVSNGLIDRYCPLEEYVSMGISELERIKKLLWDTFDTRISHLPNDEELRRSIDQGEFFGCIKDGSLVSLLQRQISNKKFYINQVINRADPVCIHSIMLGELQKYVADGGKYIYAWIASDNEASMKFHQKYGLMPDNMRCDVFILDK
ncbi:MAG: hypothetical protein J6Z43_00220 [Clostridiales bacterium]|nr:hypothetical protein [Clostridiales bacterium]